MSNSVCAELNNRVTNPRPIWRMIAVLAVLVGIVSAFGMHAANERARAVALADALLTTPPAGLPFALENLRPILRLARARLRHHVDHSPPNSIERLHAAFGLVTSDPSVEQVLIDEIATAPASECRNFVAAFSQMKTSALRVHAREASEPDLRARFAILALQLGDSQPARTMLALKNNPVDRTTFIHTYTTWHGDPTILGELLAANDDEAFRSGLCAALGTIDSAERGHLSDVLWNLYRNAPDGGTHSAAGWALREWGLALPVLTPTAGSDSHRRWFVNGQGIPMMEVAAGEFVMGTAGEAPFDDESPAHAVRITRPFFLADREVTVGQFQRFLEDANYSMTEKPEPQEVVVPEVRPLPTCPVERVSWLDAILYCNWLSVREGRQKCYERVGKQMTKDYAGNDVEHDRWSCDFSRDGYRLPTEAEWEYAARSSSGVSYCFGEGTTRLQHYAWFANNSDAALWPGSMKQPNAWGLHDMHGNVAEWCWDLDDQYPVHEVSDPTGSETGTTRVLRGGSVGTGALACRSAFRSSHVPTFRNANNGFRVCCTR